MTHTIERDVMLAIRTMTEGMEDVRVLPNYSGRSMYGRTCLALVVDDGVSGLVRWTFALVELVEGEVEEVGERVSNLIEALRYLRTRVDNLGHSTVYYWPEVDVEEYQGATA